MLDDDNFSTIYDSMNENYGELEIIMSKIYENTKNNPNDESSKELLRELGNLAKKMIDSQREFTSSYGDITIKDSLINKLDIKKIALENSLEETETRIM